VLFASAKLLCKRKQINENKKGAKKVKKCNYCGGKINENSTLKQVNLVHCRRCDITFDTNSNIVKKENGVTFYGFSK